MRKLYVLVGLPGSGKTTLSKNILDGNTDYYSSDLIRNELIEYKHNHLIIFREMNKRVIESLKNFKDVIYDSTNLEMKYRKELYDKVKRQVGNVKVIIIFIHTTLETAIKQNELRTGAEKVPMDLIREMYLKMESPIIGVDCDNLFIPSIYKKDGNFEVSFEKFDNNELANGRLKSIDENIKSSNNLNIKTTVSNKIAIVADIHANKYAMQVFLDYINKNNIKLVLNMGDFIQIGPNPKEVADIIINDKRFINIIGNNEESLFKLEDKIKFVNEEKEHQLWNIKELGNENIEKITNIPCKRFINVCGFNILMIHDLDLDILKETDLDKLKKHNIDVADIILFGHTHKALYLKSKEKVFINPGSLGCSKESELSFVILEIENDNIINIEFKVLKYDNTKLIQDYYIKDVPDKERILKDFQGGVLGE